MSQLTPADLAAAFELTDPLDRALLFERYSKQKPIQEAIPFLRRAVADEYHFTVKVAAKALGKLGPLAVEAMDDLVEAAYHQDEFHLPQAYAECVEAMVAIQPSHPALLPLIKQSVGYDNWIPISASLRALKTIGTPEAIDLMHRIARFWEPELNKMQRRVVEKLLQEIGNKS